MRKNIVKLLSIIIVGFIGSSQAYDGRGPGNCGQLRSNLQEAQQELQEAKTMYRDMRQSAQRSHRQSQQLVAAFQSSFTPIEVPVDDSLVYEAKDQYERAVLAYNSNGCTSGGRTNYNHNYNYSR